MSTLAQQKAVAIAPKFTAFASILGSSTVAFLVWKRAPKKTTYHRLVLGMSIVDLMASIAWFFTTWPIPRGTPGVYGAVGTQETCSAQAFFAQFSLSTVMYNASLAVYYVLVVVKKKKDNEIARIEPWMHVNALAWGLGTGIGGLSLTLFNQVGWDCWISAAPLGCKETWTLEEGEVGTCERGDNGSLYQWAFYYAPLWFVIVLVSVLMYWVYAHVRNQERKMSKYAVAEETKKKMTQQRRVKNQASMYVGAFLITWLFPTLFQLVIVIANKFPYPLLLLTAIFVPIQGALNLLVFIRPKYIRYKEKNPDTNMIVAWFQMLYLEVTGTAPNRTVVTSAYASSANPNNDTSSKTKKAFNPKATFRLKEFKPTSASDVKEEDIVDEEKVEEDAAMAQEQEEDEVKDDPKQTTFDEEVSP